MKIKPLVAVVAAILLAGCESVPKSTSVSAPPLAAVGPDAATIVFFRPTSPPAAVKGSLSLDSFEVGQVFVRRYALLQVAPGTHEIRFSFPFWVGVPAQSIEFECKPNAKYYISYTSLMGVGAVYPATGTIVFSVTPEMHLVSEDEALPYMSRFALAFTYGKRLPNQPPQETPGTAPSSSTEPEARRP